MSLQMEQNIRVFYAMETGLAIWIQPGCVCVCVMGGYKELVFNRFIQNFEHRAGDKKNLTVSTPRHTLVIVSWMWLVLT